MDIKDVLKERKKALKKTYPEIVEESGLPLNTIQNFFSQNSKSPSLYTAAMICKALGVSLDKLFGISEQLTTTEAALQAENKGLEKRLSNKKETIDTQNHAMDLLEKGLRLRNHLIAVMFILLVGLLLWCVHLDMQCADIGFWRG